LYWVGFEEEYKIGSVPMIDKLVFYSNDVFLHILLTQSSDNKMETITLNIILLSSLWQFAEFSRHSTKNNWTKIVNRTGLRLSRMTNYLDLTNRGPKHRFHSFSNLGIHRPHHHQMAFPYILVVSNSVQNCDAWKYCNKSCSIWQIFNSCPITFHNIHLKMQRRKESFTWRSRPHPGSSNPRRVYKSDSRRGIILHNQTILLLIHLRSIVFWLKDLVRRHKLGEDMICTWFQIFWVVSLFVAHLGLTYVQLQKTCISFVFFESESWGIVQWKHRKIFSRLKIVRIESM